MGVNGPVLCVSNYLIGDIAAHMRKGCGVVCRQARSVSAANKRPWAPVAARLRSGLRQRSPARRSER
jgi:hypothetical protein